MFPWLNRQNSAKKSGKGRRGSAKKYMFTSDPAVPDSARGQERERYGSVGIEKRQGIVAERKMQKLERMLDDKLHHPHSKEYKDAMAEVLGKLGKQILQTRITDSVVDRAEKEVKEVVRQHQEEQRRQEEEALLREAIAKEKMREEELRRHKVDSPYDTRSQSRSQSRSGARSRGTPVIHDEYEALLIAQQQAQERAAVAVKQHERAVKAQTKEALLTQIEEHKRALKQRKQQQKQELERVRREQEEYQAELDRREREKRKKQSNIRNMYTESLTEKRRYQEAQRMRQMEEERRYIDHMNERDYQQYEKEINSKLKHKEVLRQVHQQNLEQQELRRRQKEREKAEEKRILAEYTRKLEKEEQQRQEYLRKTQANQHMYDPTGQNWPESYKERHQKEKAEEKRRLDEALEYERIQEEREQQRKYSKRKQAQQRVAYLDQQVREKQEYASRHRHQEELERQRMEREFQKAKESELDERRRKAQQQAEYRRQLREQQERDRQIKSRQVHMTPQEQRIHQSYLRKYLEIDDEQDLPQEVQKVTGRFAATPTLASSTGLSAPVSPYDAAYEDPKKHRHGRKAYDYGKAAAEAHRNQKANLNLPQLDTSPSSMSPNAHAQQRHSPFGSAAKNMFN